MLIEVSIELYMTGLISIVSNPMGNFLKVLSLICSWLVVAFLISVMVLLPLFLEKNSTRLYKPEFKRKYGSIYEEISSHNRFARYFYSFFLARRFIVALALVFLGHWPGGQIAIMDLCSLLNMVYLGMAKPFKEGLSNALEVFNESSVFIVGVSMMTFSDSQMDPIVRYDIGWIVISIVILNSVITMGYSFYNSIKQLITLIRRTWRQWRAKKDSVKKEPYVKESTTLDLTLKSS